MRLNVRQLQNARRIRGGRRGCGGAKPCLVSLEGFLQIVQHFGQQGKILAAQLIQLLPEPLQRDHHIPVLVHMIVHPVILPGGVDIVVVCRFFPDTEKMIAAEGSAGLNDLIPNIVQIHLQGPAAFFHLPDGAVYSCLQVVAIAAEQAGRVIGAVLGVPGYVVQLAEGPANKGVIRHIAIQEAGQPSLQG